MDDAAEVKFGFKIDYASNNRCTCKDKDCRAKIEKNSLRIGRDVPSPFHEGSTQTHWYHSKCAFNALKRTKATTKKIETVEDLSGFESLNPDDQQRIRDLISGKVSVAPTAAQIEAAKQRTKELNAKKQAMKEARQHKRKASETAKAGDEEERLCFPPSKKTL